jgi:hypothetical protein
MLRSDHDYQLPTEAIRSQLDRAAQSKKAVAELLAIKPDFLERGHILIHHCVKNPDMKGRVVEGLAVGGLVLE